MTIKEAAKLARVTETTVNKAIERGRLNSTKLFNARLIKPADFDAWRASTRRGRPASAKPVEDAESPKLAAEAKAEYKTDSE